MASYSPGYITGEVIGFIVLTALYLAPSIVAAVLRSSNLLAVVLIDVLLGWTVVGWIVAWVLIFTGQRGDAPAATWPSTYGGYGNAHNLSPDRMFWWDGIAWRDTRVVAPPSAPRSPDGWWWWDGVTWRQVPQPPPAPPQTQAPPSA